MVSKLIYDAFKMADVMVLVHGDSFLEFKQNYLSCIVFQSENGFKILKIRHFFKPHFLFEVPHLYDMLSV